MSLIALKRKYEAIKKFNGVNTAATNQSASAALRNRIQSRSNENTFLIVPNTLASSYTQKKKSDELFAHDTCQSNNNTSTSNCANRIPNAPIHIKQKICNVHNNLTVNKSSDYNESVKQQCLITDTKPRIANLTSNC